MSEAWESTTECEIPMPGFHDQLLWSDGHVYAGEFTASHYQQPERIDPRHGIDMNKDGSTLHWVPVCPTMPKFSGNGSWEAYSA